MLAGVGQFRRSSVPVATRGARRPADHRRARPADREPGGPVRDRVGGERDRPACLPARSVAGYRRRADTGANATVALAAIGVSAIVLVFFIVDTLRNEPATFVAILVIVVLAG